MEALTVQAFIKGEWTDVGTISFPKSHQHNFRVTELHYLSDYALAHHDQDDYHAVSINHPVSFFFDDMGKPGWLRFLDDIMPSGASRRYWVKYLDIEDLSVDEQNYILLKFGTMSPIGNLRIKDSLPERYDVADNLYFSVDDVKNRAGDFLDYAQQRGAAAGGATGAGGEAPKLVLRCGFDHHAGREKIWIDPYQDDNHNHDTHYLVIAPVYDFAPMKADPEGIPRTTKWKAPLEVGGTYDFVAIADTLSDLVPKDVLLKELKVTASKCMDLKQRLALRGVPEQILEMPAIGFNHLSQKLANWGLL